MMVGLFELSEDYIYVVLDANFILVPIQFNIDVYSEIKNMIPGKVRIVILKAVIDELELKREREKKKTFKRQVNLSLAILDQNIRKNPKLFIEVDRLKKKGEHVDNIIISVAEEINEKARVYVATNDKIVRKKCRELDIPPIFMRQRRLLKS